MIQSTTLRRFLLILGLMASLLVAPARAETWIDPSWPTILNKAQRIVLVEVVEGGDFVATVKALKTFKGEASEEPFTVTGFNDRDLSKANVAKGAFKKGDSYYLFLRANKEAYSPPTPTSGILALSNAKVPLTLHFTTWSRFRGSKRPAEDVDELLAMASKFQTDGTTNMEYLDRLARSAEAMMVENQKDTDHLLLSMHLAGEKRFHEFYPKLVEHSSMHARLALARLLGQVEDERAPKILEQLLSDNETHVQGEAVRQFAKGDAGVVGPVLLKALSKAKPGAMGPREAMDPVRNVVYGGKLEIVRALGRLKYQPAEESLLKILEKSHDLLYFETLQALQEIGSRDYVETLVKRIETGDWLTAKRIADFIAKTKIVATKPALESFVSNRKSNTGKIRWVLNALSAIGDEQTAKVVEGRLKAEIETPRKETENREELIVDLVGTLADLNYQPAKPTVYAAVFHLIGFDETMAANPQLIEIKQRIEIGIEEQAKVALADFKGANVRCMVFLENRKELAVNLGVEPKFTSLLKVESTEAAAKKVDAKESVRTMESQRDAVARATGISKEQIHISHRQGNSTHALSIDRRMNQRGDDWMMFGNLCRFLRAQPDEKDAAFLRWAVEKGYVKKSQVNEILPSNLAK